MKSHKENTESLITGIIKRLGDDDEWADWNDSIFRQKQARYQKYNQELKVQDSIDSFGLNIKKMLDEKLYPDKFIIPLMIKKFGHIHVKYAIEIFQLAKKYGLVDGVTYNSTMNVIAKSELPDVDFVAKLLEEVKGRKQADEVTYKSATLAFNRAINMIAKNKPDANLAVEYLRKAQKNEAVDKVTYSSTMNVIAKSKYPSVDLAVKLFEEAKEQGMVDGFIYNNILDVIAKSEHPDVDLALNYFEEAKKRGIDDIVTYNSTLDVIAKSKHPDVKLAIKLYEEAKERKREEIEKVFYSRIIDVIAKSEHPDVDLALKLLEDAKKAGVVDEISYHGVMDVLVKSRKLDLARKIFHEGVNYKYIKPLQLIKENNNSIVDLHGYSIGSAYVALRELLSSPKIDSNITIIYGKGTNTPFLKKDAAHPVKQAVMQVLSDLKIQGIEDKKNPGRMTISKGNTIPKASDHVLFSPKKSDVNVNSPNVRPRKKTKPAPGSK